jgi:hypothetical protein
MNTDHAAPVPMPRFREPSPRFLHPARRGRTPAAAAGLFPPHRTPTAEAGSEDAMNDRHTNANRPSTTRRALLVTGFVLAFAVGAQWLLYEAPPSPEAVVAARVCCAKLPPVTAPHALPAR